MRTMFDRIMKSLAGLALILSITGCSEDKELSQVWAEGVEDLAGTWRLNERGYSPGFEYITEEVPALPLQIMQFDSEGRFSSNIDEVSKFRFYQVKFDDIYTQKHYITLYETEAEIIANDGPIHSYTVDFPEGELRLSFRHCFEGCHMKFAKLGHNESTE